MTMCSKEEKGEVNEKKEWLEEVKLAGEGCQVHPCSLGNLTFHW